MKNLLTIVFIVANLYFLHSQDCNISNNWTIQKQEPIPLQRQHDIYFVDDNIGYSVGVAGTMRKTENGGQTWEILHAYEESGTRAMLFSVYFIDENIGFAAGDGENYYFQDIFTDAVFMKTIDGGQTWNKTIVEGINRILDIKFYDANNGIGLFWSNEGEDIIAITNDGGQTWENIETEIDQVEKWEFIPAGDHDFVLGNNSQNETILIKFDENGEYTDTYDAPISTYNIFNPYITSYYFLNENIGYAYNLYKTTDGGETWFEASIPEYYSNSIIHFSDEQNGIIVNPVYISVDSGFETNDFLEGVEIFETSDAGLSWNQYESDLECAIVGLSHSISNGTIYFHGSYYEGKIEFNGLDLELLEMYPNPTYDIIKFKGYLPTNTDIEVFSYLGESVLKSKSVTELNVESIPSGIYFISINVPEFKQRKSFKFIKL